MGVDVALDHFIEHGFPFLLEDVPCWLFQHVTYAARFSVIIAKYAFVLVTEFDALHFIHRIPSILFAFYVFLPMRFIPQSLSEYTCFICFCAGCIDGTLYIRG